MMTQTSLTAANLGKRGEFYPAAYAASQSAGWAARRRFYRLLALSFEAPRLPRATKILIAIADASRIGILSDQRESKGLSYRSPLRHQRPQLLIANLELEFQLTHTKLSPLRISNRKFLAILCFSPSNQSRVTSHQFLIHGSAIKTPRNPFKNSTLQISNRRQTGGLRTHEPQVSSQLRSNRIALRRRIARTSRREVA
jgi:hypothetical protein